MTALPPPLASWRGTIFDGYAEEFAEGARAFFTVAIQPTCDRIAQELSHCQRGPDDDSIRHWEALRATQLDLHRSFILALGGIWERHFRSHLYQSVAVLGPTERIADAHATWEKVTSLFRECRGFQLDDMPSYADLKILMELSNVVRHGTGRASEALYLSNRAWFSHNPVSGWFSYFTRGGEPPHSIHRLEITVEHLSEFSEAIAIYWEAVAELRKKSI